MKLSPQTVEILKNFASIRETLYFPKGNTLITRSLKKHTMVEAEVLETFTKDFTIYNLNQFLSVLGQFDTPTLDFETNESYVKISNDTGGLSVRYHYGTSDQAYVPDSKKKPKMPNIDVEFDLTEIDFKSLGGLSRTLGTPEIALSSDGETMFLETLDTKNNSTNTSRLDIGTPPKQGLEFQLVWKLDYLKLFPGNYHVELCKEGLSKFTHKEVPIIYHIMLEQSGSKYDE